MGGTWIDQQTAPIVPRTLAAIGMSILTADEREVKSYMVWRCRVGSAGFDRRVLFLALAVVTKPRSAIYMWATRDIFVEDFDLQSHACESEV
jgi:hypothetical protein